jgi:hypothetical protein
LPSGTRLTAQGEDWFRFQSSAPHQQIPRVVECLVEQGLPVLRLMEVPHSLERLYLQAVSLADDSGSLSKPSEPGKQAPDAR